MMMMKVMMNVMMRAMKLRGMRVMRVVIQAKRRKKPLVHPAGALLLDARLQR
jgi:hypothetical protein